MATYRLSVMVAKRSEGRSATAMAAYRACEALTDERTGERFDFTRKSGLLFSGIVAPEDAPDWARDRQELWSRSETAHRRGDAVVCREIQLSLPHELSNFERREVAEEFAQHMADRYGVAVDLNLHAPHRDGDERNYHAHLMLCLRRFDATQESGLSKTNVREFDPVACKKAGEENHVLQWRTTWAEMLNRALERANVRDSDGVQVTVDHRSYKDRGSELEPQIKEGPAATAKKRRGEETDRSLVNDNIKARNAARLDAEELRRRQAQNITEHSAEKLLPIEKADTPENHPAGMMRRQGEHVTAEYAQEKLAASNDNAPPKLELKRMKWESDEQYQARVERTQQRIEDAKRAEKLELKLDREPKGRGWRY